MINSTSVSSTDHSANNVQGQSSSERGAERGAELYKDGRYDEALPHIQEAAQFGNPLAQYTLARMHHYGRGIPENLTEARKYYDLAVAQNYVPAIYNLIVMCLNGLGGPRDYEKAFNLANLAIQFGEPSTGLNTLAMMHMHGLYLEHDDNKAHELLEESIKSPVDNLGFIDLAHIYETGSGRVPRDRLKALQLLVNGYRFTTTIEVTFRTHYEEQFSEFIQRLDQLPLDNGSNLILRYLVERVQTIETQQHEILDLQHKIHDLQNQINYSPGGAGYQQAQEHFATLAHQN